MARSGTGKSIPARDPLEIVSPPGIPVKNDQVRRYRLDLHFKIVCPPNSEPPFFGER